MFNFVNLAMNTCALKVLFLHGLDSSRESTKFQAIDAKQKFCINVDYRNLNYQTVADFYHNIIQKIKPEILVGHSLGGYWALKMSLSHHIPCVVANPSSDDDLQHDIPQLAYLELGDEILDMHAAQAFLENYMQTSTFESGHHRLLHPENINSCIQQIEQAYLAK